MKPSMASKAGHPERVRFCFFDDDRGSTWLPLASRSNTRVPGIVLAVMFVIFAAIDAVQVARIWEGGAVEDVFDLSFVLFNLFWVLGWSVGVVILGLITVLFLFHGESARLQRGRLLHVPRIGPLKVLVEYDLAKVANPRAEPAGSDAGGETSYLRFDYDGGTETLGGPMPHPQAERNAELIAGAVEALPLRELPEIPVAGAPPRAVEIAVGPFRWQVGGEKGEGKVAKRAAPAPRPRTAGTETSPDDNRLSAAALLVSNLIPLGGVLFFGWDLGSVMVLFWAESAVVGFYNLLKMAVIGRWATLFAGPFFLGHFGGFMAGHFLFIYYMFVRGIDATGPEAPVLETLTGIFLPLWPALLAMVVSHGLSFASNFIGRREYVGRTLSDQMGEPYKRILVMHLVIIFGGWMVMLLGSAVPALVLLIALKTGADLKAHKKEHAGAVA